MAHSIAQRAARRSGYARASSTITLGLWRARRTWGMLLVTGLGMVAAVMLTCTVPLYSRVATTAGLRDVLTSAPENADMIVTGPSQLLSGQYINDLTAQINQEFQQKVQPYPGPARFSLEVPPGPLMVNTFLYNGRNQLVDTRDRMQLVSEPMSQVGPHLTLLRGRLPRTLTDARDLNVHISDFSADLEIALTPEEAEQLSVDVTSVIPLHIGLVTTTQVLRLHVVGIFRPLTQNSTFWHDHNFQRSSIPHRPEHTYTALTSSESLLAIFNAFYLDPIGSQLTYDRAINLFWYYRFQPAQATIDNLNSMVDGFNTLRVDIANVAVPTHGQLVNQVNLAAFMSSNSLQTYRSRILLVQVPTISLLILVIGLVLFFVTMMTDLLVERQTESIAILRSRGMSRGQIFGAFVTQGVGLGLLALIVGPLLALACVRLLTYLLLPPHAQNTFDLIATNPWQAMTSVGWLALGTAAVAVLAMALAVNRARRADALTIRREVARSTHRPLWQRLHLDALAIIVLIITYGFVLYLTNSNILDARLRTQLLAPLTVLGTVCLLIAGIMLFLRLFPRLLTGGAWLAGHNRGAAPLLALAQMARAPRQSLRMTLLLAFTTAFAIFSLVFLSTQAQRVQDVAAYQSGADFSGSLVNPIEPDILAQQTAAYHHLPGVSSASLGYTGTLKAGTNGAIPIALRAVDAGTFATTASWTPQESSQSIDTLMQQLISRRTAAIAGNIIPAIVDSQAASVLNLAPNVRFTLTSTDGQSTVRATFVVITVVQAIPTIFSSSQANSGSENIPAGGVLADYRTYEAIYKKAALADNGGDVSLNYAWLRTSSDPTSLARIRDALTNSDLRLGPLNDRRAMLDDLTHDPLYLTILGVLATGTTTALLLALLGNLLASWLSARGRLTNFAVMRALGTSPRQVAGVLTWEQGIIYTLAIGLGIVSGLLFSLFVVPSLVFTSAPGVIVSTGSVAISQSIPPIQLVFSPLLILGLAALVAICVIALWLMVRVVSRPSIGQTLRINED